MSIFYKTYAEFLKEHFDGKIQKLALNAFLGCPNRDGTVGLGGCIYCDNRSFNPSYCSTGDSITRQIRAGRDFFARKYPQMRYLAYFQAYTGSHGTIDRLTTLYRSALDEEDVVGLIIGTRPDCMPEILLDRLLLLKQEYGKEIILEYGAESSHDKTLRLVNRCHDWKCTVDAVIRSKQRGFLVGLHFIMGLPGESEEMMMETIDRLNALPVDTVKFHQLQVIRGTRLHKLMESGEIEVMPFSLKDYLSLCISIVHNLNKKIAIERFTGQAPEDMLIAPKWGIKNHVFVDMLNKSLSPWQPK